MEKQNSPASSEMPLEKRKFDLVIVGGGPSTLSFISHIFQRRHADKFFNSMNILIIEKGELFGSGCLGYYGINTNTSSEGFPRLICYTEGENKEKAAKFALSPSKNNMKASKNYNNEIKKQKGEKILEYENTKEKLIFKKIPIFNELFTTSAVQTLLAIGNRPAPLSLVGHFLDCLGNFITHYVKKNYNKNILMNNTEVKSIKMYNNDEFGLVLKKSNCDTNLLIKTRCLILSTGGKQTYENSYLNQIVSTKGEYKVHISDYVLKEEGYNKLVTSLHTKEKGKKKIVIIGGSHSGFSCAWILLNGPSSYRNIKIGTDYQSKSEDTCDKCQPENCMCYGKVFDRNWNQENLKQFSQDYEITILYRDHIKVYYPSEEEAVADNYTVYNSKEACNKQGRVYPFIGIRGDAKELYKKILNGEEKRVKLIPTPSNKDQTSYINEADSVIWACGYVTNSIPFYDSRNHPVDFATDELGTIEVDKQLQLINKNKLAFKNLYGLGQGYSTKTPEIINGKKARADSIHIYNTYIAAKLYRSLEIFINKVAIENLSKGSLFNSLKRTNEYESQRGSQSNLMNVNGNNFKYPKKSLYNPIKNSLANTLINKENEIKERKKSDGYNLQHTTKNLHKTILPTINSNYNKASPGIKKNVKNTLSESDVGFKLKPKKLVKDFKTNKNEKDENINTEKLEKVVNAKENVNKF